MTFLKLNISNTTWLINIFVCIFEMELSEILDAHKWGCVEDGLRVISIVIGNVIGNLSSNPGQGCLCFNSCKYPSKHHEPFFSPTPTMNI